MDRSRYDSALFWLPFGTAAAVIGVALMTIGLTRLAPADNMLGSVWFDSGLGLLVIGALLLLWSLWLYLGARRDAGRATDASSSMPATSQRPKGAGWMNEAVRGYYKERENMFRIWQKEQKEKKNRR
jgi:hypothetical protein